MWLPGLSFRETSEELKEAVRGQTTSLFWTCVGGGHNWDQMVLQRTFGGFFSEDWIQGCLSAVGHEFCGFELCFL